MQGKAQEVSFEPLKYLLTKYLNAEYDADEIDENIIVNILKKVRKIFTFIVADLSNKQSTFIMPANICWFQFINPIKIVSISKQKIVGILLSNEVQDILNVCILFNSTISNQYDIKHYKIDIQNDSIKTNALFKLICTCTTAVVQNAYVFKNYEKFNIRKQMQDRILSLYYAPTKVGLISQNNYIIQYELSTSSELIDAKLEKYNLERVKKN